MNEHLQRVIETAWDERQEVGYDTQGGVRDAVDEALEKKRGQGRSSR